MKRFLLATAALFTAGILIVSFQNTVDAPADEPAWYHKKKGVGMSLWAERDPSGSNHDLYAQNAYVRLKSLNGHWYYTWGTRPFKYANRSDRFFPMIWGYNPLRNMPLPREGLANDQDDLDMPDQIAEIRRSLSEDNLSQYGRLLLFNEPEHGNNPIGEITPELGAEQTLAWWNDLRDISRIVVPPVMATAPDGSSNSGTSWLDGYFSRISLDSFADASDGRRVVPLHIYVDPFKLGFAKGADDFNDATKRAKVSDELLEEFLLQVHRVKRRHEASIMITEFGVNDWGAEDLGIRNRIPASFVARFYERLLPELHRRSYITHFALFSNHRGSDNRTAEKNRANAAFRRDADYDHNGDPTTGNDLTGVGRVYRDSVLIGDCQYGEYKNVDGNIVEYIHESCGAPTAFGWVGNNLEADENNGWFFASRTGQYRRILTPEEAGVNAVMMNGCYRDRVLNAADTRITERRQRKEGCEGPTGSAWAERTFSRYFYNSETGTSSRGNVEGYIRNFNIRTERVGIMQFPVYELLQASSASLNRARTESFAKWGWLIRRAHASTAKCQRSEFLWNGGRYEKACGCSNLSGQFYPVNEKGSNGKACRHRYVGPVSTSCQATEITRKWKVYERTCGCTRQSQDYYGIAPHSNGASCTERFVSAAEVKCEKTHFIWNGGHYEQACGCSQLPKGYYQVSSKGSAGQACRHKYLGPTASVSLSSGFTLKSNESKWISYNALLVMQNDGNLVFYLDGKARWASGTWRKCTTDCKAVFQSDGNFVIYKQNGVVPIYTSDTWGRGKKIRISTSAPHLSVLDAQNQVIWAGQGRLL